MAVAGRCRNVRSVSRQGTTYQPDSRFWPLQGIETGIFVAAAVALLGIAAWWAVRRIN